MKKRFDRYFGNNIGRKLYIASLALIAVGVIIGYFYFWGYGMPLAALGVIGFLVCSGIQVTDKDIDEHIENALEEFKKRIDGRVLGKKTLDARDFSYFCGFLREDSQTRFVSGRDGKVRTSKYFITAISASRNGSVIFSAVCDLLAENEIISESFIETNGSEKADLATEVLEFPAGNKKCTLTVNDGETLLFYVPNDALADKLLDTVID